MIIGGLQKLSLIDYPGKLSCVIFLAGCPFRCPWCYNPELVIPEKIKGLQKISEKRIIYFLKRNKGYLEGIVLTGGEPTISPKLVDFCRRIKDMGYDIKLDTSGCSPEVLKQLIEKKLIDYVAMDVKAPKDRYSKITGITDFFNEKRARLWEEDVVRKINQSIAILKKGEIEFEFRTTVVPNFLEKEDVLEIAKWISPTPKYYLQEFKPWGTVNPKFKNTKPYNHEYLLEILEAVRPFFDICELRS